MAKSKTFQDNGTAKRFNKEAYTEVINRKAKRENKAIQEMEVIIAEITNTSWEAVRKWRFASAGGPGDLEPIKKIGLYLCNDPDAFLTTISEEAKMAKLTDRQLNAFKRVHDEILIFLADYFDTNGFCSFREEELDKTFEPLSDSATTEEIQEAVEKAYGMAGARAADRWMRLLRVLEQESFDLHGTELYDELWDLIQAMNEFNLPMEPVHDIVETEDREIFDVIDDKRLVRLKDTLKKLVEKYN